MLATSSWTSRLGRVSDGAPSSLFRFHATSSTGEERVGLYEVNCQIHDPGGHTPRGTSEGVKANAHGVNFNKHVTGDNLLVMLP
jgi:hypothetical protein